jgi:hypothetical protein
MTSGIYALSADNKIALGCITFSVPGHPNQSAA